jgi:hypothetical protein
MYFETVVVGLYCGAIASILCILYREHRLVTLGGVGWACCGAWLGAWLTKQKPPFSEFGIWFLLAIILVSFAVVVLGAFWRTRVFMAHPTLFLFLGLGSHILISVGGGNTIPVSLSSTLQSGVLDFLFGKQSQAYVLPLVLVAIAIFSTIVVRNRRFARHALDFRQFMNGDDQLPIPAKIRWAFAGLITLQLVLLLALGAVSHSVNQGNYLMTSKHMAICVIATVACYGIPWLAFLSALTITVLELIIYTVFPDSAVASSISLLIFIVGAAFVAKPISGVSLTPPNVWLRDFSARASDVPIQCGIIAVAPGIIWALWQYAQLSESRLLSIIAWFALTLATYSALKFCGIASATLPAIGACMTFDLAVCKSTFMMFIVMIVIAGGAIAYMCFIRHANARFALLTDLCIVFSLHELVGMRQVSGADSALNFGASIFADKSAQITNAYLIIWIAILFLSVLIAWVRLADSGRSLVFSMSDPHLAIQHRRSPGIVLLVFSTVLVIVAFVVQFAVSGSKGTISPSIADPQIGISCLLVAYIMASFRLVFGLMVGLFFYVLPEDLLSFFGVYVPGEFTRLLILLPISFAVYWEIAKLREQRECQL